jgi:putative DNA primase/helicase
MLALWGEDIRWNGAYGYCVWDGKRWKTDAETQVTGYAELTILSMYDEASDMLKEAAKESTPKEKRKQLSSEAENLNRWARTSETRRMLEAIVGLTKAHVLVEAEQFDTYPYLVNFNNGTVDVRDGILRAHCREDYLTQIAPFNYNPLAKAPLFEQFYTDIMLERKELMHFMHKALGLSMTGDISEHAWFLLLGTGENGKTTLLELISHALGDYADVMNDKTIALASNGGGDGSSPSPDIARLKGKRLITVSETEDGARLATQLVKRMSGGERETARFLNKNPFTFRYTHKLFIYTNHELVIKETGHGFWRRVNKVPFDYQVPSHKKDEQLPVKLQEEVEGVLAWLVAGAMLWAKEGLGMPEIVKHATDEYKEGQDILAQFIKGCCETGASLKAPSQKLFTAFNKWQEEEINMRTYDARIFKRMMLDHGYKADRQNNGVYYKGIALKEDVSLVPSKVSSNGHKPPANTGILQDLEEMDAAFSQIEGL